MDAFRLWCRVSGVQIPNVQGFSGVFNAEFNVVFNGVFNAEFNGVFNGVFGLSRARGRTV